MKSLDSLYPEGIRHFSKILQIQIKTNRVFVKSEISINSDFRMREHTQTEIMSIDLIQN